MGEQYNPAFGHPHVFRQHVLQPHDTIRNSRVGVTGRSVVSGTKLSSLYCQPHSLGHKLLPFHCCLFSLVLHTMCCHIRAHAVALSVMMVRSSGEQGSSNSWQQRISMTLHICMSTSEEDRDMSITSKSVSVPTTATGFLSVCAKVTAVDSMR